MPDPSRINAELPPIPAQPTRDDAIRACEVLLNVTVDFPFAKPEHRAAWLAFVLTPLLRVLQPVVWFVNLFDKSYLIRDGSGVGVGAPQYGQRRGIFAGITKKF